MKFVELCRSIVAYFATLLSTSPSSEVANVQNPLAPTFAPGIIHGAYTAPPRFRAPNGPDNAPPFICDYSALGDRWKSCSTPEDRSCWLLAADGQRYDIRTDYEASYPQGILREYWLEVGTMEINADGVNNPDGKVFNQSYPGPWIQACWGDTLRIHVKNNLKCNGTSIHWHGLRQLNTTEMDGVNGVTQCPIAPNDSYTYEFVAMQYGTTWYHSHYSLQYADGLVGPITIYGPSSSNYDEARNPILFTDWSHQSAFKQYTQELTGKPQIPKMNSVLINGTGNFAGAFSKEKYNMNVERGKKYLLRIINTSVDTIYRFTIDNHLFTVISSDFVPIQPYVTNNITVGIGQRYHIILKAIPQPNNGWLSDEGNYWMRVIPTDGCSAFETGNKPDERQGVLRYNESSTGVPTSWRNPSLTLTTCADEPYDSLIPIVPWNVRRNPLPSSDTFFEAGLQPHPGRPEQKDNFSFWTIGDNPLWLSYERPTILWLHNKTWDSDSVIVPAEDHAAGGWIYLVITMVTRDQLGKQVNRRFVPAAHPIHLHGHDFAILAQGTDYHQIIDATLNWDNPPRRDVALLPGGGYLIIAFRADNPGIWLVHCHIAWHASSGLAMQILERKKDLQKMLTPDRLKEPNRVCDNWKKWYTASASACVQPMGAPFQEDSGI